MELILLHLEQIISAAQNQCGHQTSVYLHPLLVSDGAKFLEQHLSFIEKFLDLPSGRQGLDRQEIRSHCRIDVHMRGVAARCRLVGEAEEDTPLQAWQCGMQAYDVLRRGVPCGRDGPAACALQVMTIIISWVLASYGRMSCASQCNVPQLNQTERALNFSRKAILQNRVFSLCWD